MTARHALILLLIGLCGHCVAVVFKFQHWPMSGLLFLGSSLPTFLCLVLLAWKTLRHPGFKDFLDR